MSDITLQDWDWVQVGRYGTLLHHPDLTPAEDAQLDSDAFLSTARTSCGRGPNSMRIPGPFSRMHEKRCDRCCDLMGYPRGLGSPKNDDACRAILLAKAEASTAERLTKQVPALEGIITGMPEDEYHAHSALSSTGVRTLLESPARFRYQLDHPRPQKDAFDLGHAVHAKVLGTGSTVITYPDEHLTPSGNPSSKPAALAWASEQRANGFVVVGGAQAAQVDQMAEAVLAHGEARGILESIAGREVSLFAEIDGVPMRARFDIYGGNRAADLKSGRDASVKGFNRAVGAYGYHIQDRWYSEAHTAITGTELDSFHFIAVEITAPYLVAVYDLDFIWEDLAKERTKRARELYRRCTDTNTWPGYQSTTLTPPTWAIYENAEEEIQV